MSEIISLKRWDDEFWKIFFASNVWMKIEDMRRRRSSRRPAQASGAGVLCLFIQQEGSWEIKTSKFYILTHTEFQNLSRARVIYAAQFKIVTCGMCVVCLFWSHSEVKLDKVGMTQQLSVAALKWLMRRPLMMILMSLSSSLIFLMIRSLSMTQVKAAGPAPGLVSTLCVAATWRDVI